MTDNHDQPLKAADFSPRPQASAATTPQAPARPKWLLPAAGGLLLAALLVFLILPSWVGDADPAAIPTVTETSSNTAARSGSTSASTDTTERSPFAEAQLQQQRREAQEALQRVLELQEVLTELSVTEWAATEYAAAISVAEAGDAAYRERDFIQAAMDYQRAGDQLVELETSLPGRIDAAAEAITRAVESGDLEAAQAQLQRFNLLAPADPRGGLLTARVTAMPEVAAALAEATEAADNNDFAGAISATKRALNADSAHQVAQQRLGDYQQQDADARFRSAMSQGYLALENAQFERAEQAFNTASRIRPGAPEPQAAQAELANARTAATLRNLQNKGRQLEASESWEEAVAVYQEALAIDSTMLYASEGLTRAEPRATLDSAIQGIVDNRERLVDPRVLQEAEATLATAQAITDAGPRLREQISTLEATLAYARTPGEVTLSSDGVTDVTLLRVKRLGTFAETGLSLRPGSYTAMGVRTGYRDVRVNFEVKPGEAMRVDVRCTEAI